VSVRCTLYDATMVILQTVPGRCPFYLQLCKNIDR
jgi:hypothetical protein